MIYYYAYNSWKENHVFLTSMACIKIHVAMLVIMLHEETHAHIFDKLPCVQFMEGKSCIPGKHGDACSDAGDSDA